MGKVLGGAALGAIIGTIVAPGIGTALGAAALGGAAGMAAESMDAPTAPGMDTSSISSGLGTVGEGSGGKTFNEDESKRKAISKKKLGARALQIPLQSKSTEVSSGVAGDVSGTGGLQI